MTLVRWASGLTIPRPQNLRQLLKTLPSTESPLWRELIAKEFPEFAEPETGPEVENESVEIPSEFYARIINTYAITPPQRRFWAISNLVLQQALAQLDPNNVGMSITIAQCIPPSGAERRVRSLRELTGQGTPPWPANLEPQAMFLGIESLAGYTTTVGHLLTINRRVGLPTGYSGRRARLPVLLFRKSVSRAVCLLPARSPTTSRHSGKRSSRNIQNCSYWHLHPRPFMPAGISCYSRCLLLKFSRHAFHLLDSVSQSYC
jgi:hypothetical protein